MATQNVSREKSISYRHYLKCCHPDVITKKPVITTLQKDQEYLEELLHYYNKGTLPKEVFQKAVLQHKYADLLLHIYEKQTKQMFKLRKKSLEENIPRLKSSPEDVASSEDVVHQQRLDDIINKCGPSCVRPDLGIHHHACTSGQITHMSLNMLLDMNIVLENKIAEMSINVSNLTAQPDGGDDDSASSNTETDGNTGDATVCALRAEVAELRSAAAAAASGAEELQARLASAEEEVKKELFERLDLLEQDAQKADTILDLEQRIAQMDKDFESELSHWGTYMRDTRELIRCKDVQLSGLRTRLEESRVQNDLQLLMINEIVTNGELQDSWVSAAECPKEEVEEGALQCKVCYNYKKSLACVPCGHTFCSDCILRHRVAEQRVAEEERDDSDSDDDEVKEHSVKCPECREKVLFVLKLFGI